jgi:hypothetical protein
MRDIQSSVIFCCIPLNIFSFEKRVASAPSLQTSIGKFCGHPLEVHVSISLDGTRDRI